MNKKIEKAFEALKKNKCVIDSRNDSATITPKYLETLYSLIFEIIDETVELGYKGRSGISVNLTTSQLFENSCQPIPIVKINEDSTLKQKMDALSTALINVKLAVDTVERIKNEILYSKDCK